MIHPERIPAKGATSEQLAVLRERLAEFVTPETAEPASVLAHGERRRANRASAEPQPAPPAPPAFDRDAVLLARIALLGEIVWRWTPAGNPRAAIITHIHPDGNVDLMSFHRNGIEMLHGVKRGRDGSGGWTPKGSLT